MNNQTIKFDFWSKRKIFFGLSIVLLVIGIICNLIFGTTLDMKFVGGAVIKYEVEGTEVAASEIEEVVNEETGRNSSVLINQSITSGNPTVTINFAGNESISLDSQAGIGDVLSEKFDGSTFKLLESSSVDPTMGAKFLQKCIVTLLITFGLLLVYIAIRFSKIGGLSAGITALVALLHDVAITYFVFIIMGMPINDIFMAVVLTILGYSLNDTIVIYDRVRENKRIMGPKEELSNVLNVSLNQTMGRSILTSLTTFMALLIVFIVAQIYGLTTVTSFALPMMVGVLVGCYSSLFIAAPLYTMWQYRKKNRRSTKGSKPVKTKAIIK